MNRFSYNESLGLTSKFRVDQYTCRCGKVYAVEGDHNSELCRHCGAWNPLNVRAVSELRSALAAGDLDGDAHYRALQTVTDLVRNYPDEAGSLYFELLMPFGINNENTVF